MSIGAVLVTGARRRIGRSIAEAMRRDGREVVLHARDWNALEGDETAGVMEAGEQWSWDFEHPCPPLPKTAIADLVLNASLFERGEDWGASTLDVAGERERLARHLAVNVIAPWELAVRLAAAGALRSIVVVLDTYFDRPLPGHAAYQVSRAAGAGLVRSLAAELTPVRVNGVAPGTVLWSDRAAEDRAENEAEVARRTVLGRVGSAEDVVQAVRYLRDAAYVTGEILRVDGGRWKA